MPSMKRSLRGPTRWILLLAGLVILSNIFWAGFVARENTLYAWDHVAYWAMTRSLACDFAHDIGGTAGEVLHSIWNDELNLLPSLAPALIMDFLGSGRVIYILSILNLYCIPALILGFFCFRTYFSLDGRYVFWAWISAVLLLPALFQPLSLGYVGSGGLLPAFGILWLGRRDSSEKRLSVLRILSLGFLLALLTLFRRWWAFWSLSYCIVWGADRLIEAGISFKDRSRLKGILIEVFSTGLATVGILLAFGGPRVLTIAATDYAGRFVHYQGHPGFAGEISLLISRFGIFPLLIIVCGMFLLPRNPEQARRVVFLCSHLGLTWLFFRRVQLPSPQHWYLLMPGMLLLLAFSLQSGVIAVGGALRKPVLWAVPLLGVLFTGLVYSPVSSEGIPWAPRFRIRPARRNDLEQIKRMMEFLDSRLDVRDGWIYVLSASGELPESGLAFINLSLGTAFRSPQRILQTRQIDLRDGFPVGLFQAAYVIVPEPALYRGDGATQQIVRIPTEDFQKKEGVARAFSPIGPEFQIDGGIRVRVWERVRPNTHAEIEELSQRLKVLYPNHPEVWKP